MKKITKILSLLFAFVFAMSAFTACGTAEQIVEVVYEDGRELVTIQWVYGQKVLKEELVEKGTKLTSWTPVEEGREFQGWYEIPDRIKKFDFEMPIRKSMIIYASFKSVAGGNGDDITQTSTEKVYLVLDSAWNDGSVVGAWVWPDGGDGQWVETTATEDANVFEMVLPEGVNNVVFADLNAGATELGDQWANRRAQTEDLVLPGASDDKVYFHVSNNSWSNSKTEPGEPVVGGGGNGGGNPDGIPEIIFIGSFSDPTWNTSNSDPQYALTKGEDGVWTGTLTLTQEESQLKLYDKGRKYGHDGGWIDPPAGTGENGNLVLPAGTYHFKYVEGDTYFIHWSEDEDEPVGPITPPAGGGDNGGNTNTPTNPLPEGEGTLVFFVNDWLWKDVKCYWWVDDNNNNGWPGTAMVKVGTTETGNGTRDVYAIRVPAGMVGIIFTGIDNGNLTQSPDIKEGISEGAAWMMLWDGETKIVPVDYTYSAQ